MFAGNDLLESDNEFCCSCFFSNSISVKLLYEYCNVKLFFS